MLGQPLTQLTLKLDPYMLVADSSQMTWTKLIWGSTTNYDCMTFWAIMLDILECDNSLSLSFWTPSFLDLDPNPPLSPKQCKVS